MNFGTKLIHASGDIDPATGSVSTPIYQTSTFHQFDIDNFGKYDYSRSGNPTRDVLEKLIAELEGGERGFAFASGMAAIASVLSIFSAGDHIIIVVMFMVEHIEQQQNYFQDLILILLL